MTSTSLIFGVSALIVGYAGQTMAGPNQIVRHPRGLSTLLQSGQLSVYWVGVFGLLLPASYHAGVMS